MNTQPLLQPPPLATLPLPTGTSLRTLADGTTIGRYLRMDIASVFQPLIDGASGALVGNEAFVRAHGLGDLSLTPWGLFSLADRGRGLVALDRLCRIVHARNFQRVPAAPGLLFVNVHGRLLEAVAEDHGRTFRQLLDLMEFPLARVVIEIPHTANDDRRLLALALTNYRRNGFQTAINVATADELPALLRVVQTDYAKVDARGIGFPTQMEVAAELALRSGVKLVCTRVETAVQHDALHTLPGILLQGRTIAPPQALPHTAGSLCPQDLPSSDFPYAKNA